MSAPLLISPLKDICVKVVAANFEACPTFGPLPDKYVKRIIDILPLDLPLELVGTVRGAHMQQCVQSGYRCTSGNIHNTSNHL